MKIIEINNLSKSFGEIKAVCDLSFCVKEGELFAFLGVNGAGKSTLIKQILVPALSKIYGESSAQVGSYNKIEGDINALQHIEFVHHQVDILLYFLIKLVHLVFHIS